MGIQKIRNGLLTIPGIQRIIKPRYISYQKKIHILCSSGAVATMKIIMGTEEYKLFYEMALSPPKGEVVIGKGEAAALALAKAHKGIVAGNNLKRHNG